MEWELRVAAQRELDRTQMVFNLDDRGELTGEVSVKWIPNRASHGLLAWETAQPDTTGYLGWKQMQKRSQAEAGGGTMVCSRKGKGNSGDNVFRQAILPDSISISDHLHPGMRGSE